MKSKVIVINNIKLIIILFIAIIFLCILAFTFLGKEKEIKKNKMIEKIKIEVNDSEENEIKISKTNSQSKNNKIEIDFPKEIDGVKVIGKLEIPKINLTTYILEETSKETLNKSVTKLCGPKVNGIGNFCITGHNYHKDRMFGDLKDVEKNDKVLLTDLNRQYSRICYI